MPDVIRTLNKGKHDLAVTKTLFEGSTYWVTRFRIDVEPGDILFLAWDGRVQAIAPIERVWTPREADNADWENREKWPRGYFALTVARATRIHVPREWRGHVGYRYVDKLDSWINFDYSDLQAALVRVAKKYRRSDEGATEIARILMDAQQRKRRKAARLRAREKLEDAELKREERADQRRFRRETKNALWRQPQEPRLISREDREKYF